MGESSARPGRTDAERPRTLAGAALVWILVALGLVAALLLSTGLVSLDGPGRDVEATYQQGRKAYVEGDLETALHSWMAAEAQGHLGAKNDLADMVLDGHAVEKSEARAFDLYRQAAESGYAPAQTNLGLMYEHGLGTERDDERAAYWYHRAAARGHAAAQTRLGSMYEAGRGVIQSDADARHWYERAAAQGNATGQVRLGLLFKHGHGVAESPADAFFWFQQAVVQGDAAGQTELALMIQEGRGVPPNPERVRRWLEQAANQDYARAQYLLGRMHYYGDGVPRNELVSANWFARAAELGHDEAQVMLAHQLEEGRGVVANARRAEEWYREAARQGNQRAERALERLSLAALDSPEHRGRGRAQTRAELQDTADTGNPPSDNRPGLCQIGGSTELRSRLECLSRGGVFQASEDDDSGTFVTLDDDTSWGARRRELSRRKSEALANAPQPEGLDPAEMADVVDELGHSPIPTRPRQQDSPSHRSRSYRPHPSAGSASGSGSSDWIVCYDRRATTDRRTVYGTDPSSANRRLRCLGPVPRLADTSSSEQCRARGYSSRRFFKHETSARRWESDNCR